MSLEEKELLEQEDTQHGRYLTFAVGDEVFGIEIRYVTEIIGIQPITKLPEAPEHIKGVINLRGRIIPVVDVRLKFKKPPMEYNDRTCVIVVEANSIVAGLIVDNVAEVVSIADEDVVPPPEYSASVQNSYIKGIGKSDGKVKLLLDCEKLFRADEENVLRAAV
ncbi:MAG TPA: chemotaxis protein CheW [Clostridia bacterium]|jgi:purine-binding chemotaxis protein CheW|nr:chemotaxis protein CheW [Clostridia bacterium]